MNNNLDVANKTISAMTETIKQLSDLVLRNNEALKLISEDASRKQAERLPLIQTMANRQIAENSNKMLKLSATLGAA